MQRKFFCKNCDLTFLMVIFFFFVAAATNCFKWIILKFRIEGRVSERRDTSKVQGTPPVLRILIDCIRIHGPKWIRIRPDPHHWTPQKWTHCYDLCPQPIFAGLELEIEKKLADFLVESAESFIKYDFKDIGKKISFRGYIFLGICLFNHFFF